MKYLPQFQDNSKVQYLMLSCISGVIELGIPLLAFYIYQSPRHLLIATIGYQVASFITKHLELPTYVCVLAATFGTTALLGSWPKPFYLFVFTAFLISIGLHGARFRAKKSSAKVPTALKRTSRIIGFALAGFFSQTFWFLFAVGCLVAGNLFLYQKKIVNEGLDSNKPQKKRIYRYDRKISTLGVIMVTHQIHYFVYCYVILYWIASSLSSAIYFSGIFFSLGWISYLTSEPLLKKFKTHIVLIYGHISLTMLLFALFIADKPPLFILLFLWTLTGFGGGTVFCLRISNQGLPSRDQVDLDFWEDIGHVAGVVLCSLISLTTNTQIYSFMAGGGMALVTALMFYYWYSSHLRYSKISR